MRRSLRSAFHPLACAAFVASLAGTLRAASYEIGEALSDAAFWKSDAVLFVKRHQEQGFSFTSEDRLSADSRRDGGVTCYGLPVYETRVTFEGSEGIARVEILLYNRGGTERLEDVKTDDGRTLRHLVRADRRMSRDDFARALATVRERLSGGGRAPAVTKEKTREARVRQFVQSWPKSDASTVATLLWNYSQDGNAAETFEPGFIRLSVDGPSRASAGRLAKAGPKLARGAKKIAENVVRDPRGDVFIDGVPMVDQGAKGYCSVATAERVMRYYGVDVDEHEIAEAAGTSADEGTSTLKMKQSVERIGRRYRLGTTLLYGDFEADSGTRIANIVREVANYNKAAKKLKKPGIAEDAYVTRSGNTITYSLSAVDEAMDPEVLKEMKVNGAQKSKYVRFRKDVRQYVDRGIPLFWGVTLGTYPEEGIPQSKGGHMRLVIGYNDKKDEILYSDTWGKGHELKRMPAAWAWTISRCLLVLKPLR